MKDITVLIGTCDAYSPLWENFVSLMNRQWQVSCPKFVVSEDKPFEHEGYTCITPGNDIWSNRMLKGLDMIDTKYTFFILEDYFFTEPITNDEIDIHIDFLNSVDGNKVMMEGSDHCWAYKHSALGKDILGRKILKLSEYSDYLTSMQPSIWKTEHLKRCMQKNWSPWDFEIKGTDAIRGLEKDSYIIQRPKKPYWNAVRAGMKLSPGWEEVQSKYNLKDMNIG